MKLLSFSVLALAILYGREVTSQGIIDTIFVDFGEQCSKTGNNLGGLVPPSASWLINIHCKNYNGSVGCQYEKPEDAAGTCQCNMGDDAVFNATLKTCLGKVGAYCTAEKTDLIPSKLCTANADCVPIQSEGHTVGKCQCIYGYKNENGLCVVDSTIPEPERSTPRTTTTTEAPDRGPVEIPLDLLINIHIGEYGQRCEGSALFPLLNRTYCNTQELTVACSSTTRQCECNMGTEDSVFDEEVGRCVGRTGSYCLTRENLLGIKGCVKNADCVLEGVPGTSFGTCQCLPGFSENPVDGTCTKCEEGEDCTIPPTRTTTEMSGSPGTGSTGTTPGGTGGTGGTGPTGTTQAQESTTAGALKISLTLFNTFSLVFVMHLLV